jgi:hypothetical protein
MIVINVKKYENNFGTKQIMLNAKLLTRRSFKAARLQVHVNFHENFGNVFKSKIL